MIKSKTLYRDPTRGKVAGVCAGIADYFSVEVWLVRIVTITAFLLTTGTFIFVCYIAAWLILDKKPAEDSASGFTASGTDGHAFSGKGYRNASSTEKVCVKSKVWQAGMPPKQAFVNIQQRFNRSENRLRKLESYVTSKEFQLNRELNRL
ncbi:envelope stress response membrane protein PspC [Glaciecola sp. SC05]|uniref:envelope stress response membrane protein PspC n=1 Tax=Glaciecola sp. SC05 TaxID=1987355 RepID=UPI0035296330